MSSAVGGQAREARADYDGIGGRARHPTVTSSFVNRTGFSMPVLGDEDVVLDADPEAAADVDARLDRDDVAGSERVGALGREARRFVDVEAEAVAEAVAERAREGAAVDDGARGGVGVDAGHAGANRVEARLLRRENDRVRLLHLPRRARRSRACACSRTCAADVARPCR